MTSKIRYKYKRYKRICLDKNVKVNNNYKYKMKRGDFMNTKYIFVTGGVVSGLGKGITAASLRKITKKQRIQSNNSKIRSIYKCRSRNNESL